MFNEQHKNNKVRRHIVAYCCVLLSMASGKWAVTYSSAVKLTHFKSMAPTLRGLRDSFRKRKRVDRASTPGNNFDYLRVLGESKIMKFRQSSMRRKKVSDKSPSLLFFFQY